jgi:hypothetical protein
MKELTIEDVRKRLDQEMEQLDDIIEIIQMSRKLRHPMWPEELKALKEAFEACYAEDWEKCRSALLVYLEYVYEDILHLDVSQWNNKHIFRWKKMLEATELAYESENNLYCIFYDTIKYQILHRIPPNFRLAYKDFLNDLSPGFIEMLQKFTNDRELSELYDEISDFMNTSKEPDAQSQPT